MTAWQPTDIGTVGRRAAAWFLRDGLTVMATDADAAKHAMDIVLVALHQFGREQEASRFYAYVVELLRTFPAVPDDACIIHDLACGQVDSDAAVEKPVGYGYVKPAAQGHECGGALFDAGRQTFQYFNTRTVWLVSGRAQ